MQTGAGNGTESVLRPARAGRAGKRLAAAIAPCPALHSAAGAGSGNDDRVLRKRPGKGNRRRLGVAVLVVAAGVLLQTLREALPRNAAPEQLFPPLATEPPDLERAGGAEGDSGLRRFALLPAQRPPEPTPQPLPNSVAGGAERLGEALSVYPQPQWPEILGKIRKMLGPQTCPFLWVDGGFTFILPEAAPGAFASAPAASAAVRPENAAPENAAPAAAPPATAPPATASPATAQPATAQPGQAQPEATQPAATQRSKAGSGIASLPASLGRCAQAVARAPYWNAVSPSPATPDRSKTATSSPPETR